MFGNKEIRMLGKTTERKEAMVLHKNINLNTADKQQKIRSGSEGTNHPLNPVKK
jgi:hypothetical protein